MCRWQSPESLLIYRRMGLQDHIQWIDRSFDTDFDAGSMPGVTVDSAVGLSYLADVSTSEGPSSSSARSSTSRARPTSSEEPSSSSTRLPSSRPRAAPPALHRTRAARRPAADSRPLTAENAVGRIVLVPASLWPSYQCTEHEGKGWEARILNASSRNATIRFAYAVTARGRRYKDERLPLGSLVPL